MDAIKLLTADHKTLRALLAALAATTARATKKRTQLLDRIARELRIHSQIEEEIFYPVFRKAGKTGDDDRMFFEAMEEHRTAGDLVLLDLLDTDVASEQFSGRAKVLRELVEHHAGEEETEMFPRAKELLTRAELDAVGDALMQRKSDLLGGILPVPSKRKSFFATMREIIAPDLAEPFSEHVPATRRIKANATRAHREHQVR